MSDGSQLGVEGVQDLEGRRKEEEAGGAGWSELTGRKVILAVDDVGLHLMRMSEILTPEFEVRVAKSAKAAMKILDTTRVDLMLLDIEMPDITGFDFLEMIRKNPARRGIPAIFVTAHATPEFVVRATRTGAVDYVVKPFNQENLVRKVHLALSGQKNSRVDPPLP
jgi:putative two-component system response regulator